ncbi:MAG: hypothetical protein IT447_06940 [Phycisphaerales bacterium]|nr:hypothetical protein [Phycisphaerales bacterium]
MRIGQILSQMANWTHHELEEILYEQTHTRQRFGDIAVALGYCDADQVRQASVAQLAARTQKVDLRRLGVDAQALSFLPYSLALRFHAIPIRISEDQLIVATDMPADHPGRGILQNRIAQPVRFVLADAQQIRESIEQYYAPLCACGSSA